MGGVSIDGPFSLHPVAPGAQRVFHLHRFKDRQPVACRNLLPRLDKNRLHQPRHRGHDDPRRGGILGGHVQRIDRVESVAIPPEDRDPGGVAHHLRRNRQAVDAPAPVAMHDLMMRALDLNPEPTRRKRLDKGREPLPPIGDLDRLLERRPQAEPLQGIGHPMVKNEMKS